jgi:hypothetical protein
MTENRIPPDAAEYLSGPMPKYADGKFTVNGVEVDANALEPIDQEDNTLDPDEAEEIE